jgi:hypothetical protein
MSWQTCGSTVICGGFAALALAAGTATASAAMTAVRAARGLGGDKVCIDAPSYGTAGPPIDV